VIGVQVFKWFADDSERPFLDLWGWLSMACILSEAALFLALKTRCQEKGIQMRELLKTSFELPVYSKEKDLKRSFREMIDEMRKLYGSKS
jgi:hypothetical protein